VSLSPADRERIEALWFDPDATIAFNEITACLVWSDEWPEGLSPAGYEYVRDLLGARGYLHRGVPLAEWDFGSSDRIERWTEAHASGLRWNGFRRLELGDRERALLERYLRDDAEL
jgi:hypothetical protein